VQITNGYNSNYLGISIFAVAPSDGLWHITNPWVFAPNNTLDRSDPFAPDDMYIAALTGPNGSTPSMVRFMDSFLGEGGESNFVDPEDLPNPNYWSWQLPYFAGQYHNVSPPSSGTYGGIVAIQHARFLNTDSGNATYSWYSDKLYSSQNWAIYGPDSFGTYLSMTGGPLGKSDNGTIMSYSDTNSKNYGAIEFRTNSPHGLKTGWKCLIGDVSNGLSLNWSFNSTVNGSTLWAWGASGTGGYQDYEVFVTGPNTFGILYNVTGNLTGSTIQTLTSTTEIPVNMTASVAVPLDGFGVPYEFGAAFVKRLPNTALWCNLSAIGSDSLLQLCADKVCANIGTTNPIWIESGNEHWNEGSFVFTLGNWQTQQSNFTAYYPNGTNLYTYYTAHGTRSFRDETYAINAAHQYKVFADRCVSNGIPSGMIKRIYGSQYTNSAVTQGVGNAITTYNMPADYICVAPYQGLGGAEQLANNDSTIKNAFSPPGYPGNTPAGWSVDAINDFFRYFMMFSLTNQGFWQGHQQYLPAGVRLVCYEGAVDYLLPDSIVNYIWMGEDCLWHPSFYDLATAYFLFCQQGNPQTLNSGAAALNYFILWCNISQNNIGLGPPFWRLIDGVAQPIGRGFNNRYMTMQGGQSGPDGSHPYGYAQSNQSPGFQALLDWNNQLDSNYIFTLVDLEVNTNFVASLCATYNLGNTNFNVNVQNVDNLNVGHSINSTFNTNVTCAPSVFRKAGLSATFAEQTQFVTSLGTNYNMGAGASFLASADFGANLMGGSIIINTSTPFSVTISSDVLAMIEKSDLNLTINVAAGSVYTIHIH